MVNIAVNGAAGRMGNRILALASESGAFKVIGKFDHDANSSAGIEKLSDRALLGKEKGVLIDFSSPEGTRAATDAALKGSWGLVVGTTGLDDKTQEALSKASQKIPVVVSSNMSVGVNLMLELLRQAAHKLPKEFTIKITEAHHRHKKDAPSGTALTLAKEIAAAKRWEIKELLASWKAGNFNRENSNDKMRMKVIREGEIVGDHTVLFSGPSESLEITHRAQSRDTFARGALVAALFLSKKKKGLFRMADVLQ